QPIPRVVREFVSPEVVGAASGDVADSRASRGVHADHAALGVGYEKKRVRADCHGHDAVGTGRGAGSRKASEAGDSVKLRDKFTRLGVDDVDGHIGTIGKIVFLSCLVDPADIEGIQTAG